MEQIGKQQSKEKEKERERHCLYTRHVKKETWNLFTRS